MILFDVQPHGVTTHIAGDDWIFQVSRHFVVEIKLIVELSKFDQLIYAYKTLLNGEPDREHISFGCYDCQGIDPDGVLWLTFTMRPIQFGTVGSVRLWGVSFPRVSGACKVGPPDRTLMGDLLALRDVFLTTGPADRHLRLLGAPD